MMVMISTKFYTHSIPLPEKDKNCHRSKVDLDRIVRNGSIRNSPVPTAPVFRLLAVMSFGVDRR